MIGEYIDRIKKLLETVENREEVAMNQAAQKIADTIQNDGIIHLFGSGHSNILVNEVYYRAGGLVPVQPILHEPLMLHKGATQLALLERKNNYAIKFMKNKDIRPNDLVIVISTSGRNPVPIDVALISKNKGAYVIGMTSVAYSRSQQASHSSGQYLYQVVDLVIDNHASIGDAILSHDQVGERFSPSSTVIGSAILNAIFGKSITLMAKNNFKPPIFLSGNLERAEEHNQQLIAKYSDRLFF